MATLRGSVLDPVKAPAWRKALFDALVGIQNLDGDAAKRALKDAAEATVSSDWASVRQLLQLRYDMRWGREHGADSARHALVSLIEETKESQTIARAWHTLGVHHLHQNEYSHADRALVEALTLVEDSPTRAWVLDSLGQSAMWQGAWTESRYLFHAAKTLKEAAGDNLGIAITLGNVALLELGLGRPEQAEKACAEALRGVGLPVLTRLRLATLHLQAQLDAGHDSASAEQVVSFWEQTGEEPHHLKGFAGIAIARATHKDTTACKRWLDAAEQQFRGESERAMVNYWRARLIPDSTTATWDEDTRVLLSGLDAPSEAELLTELLLAERAFNDGNVERGHGFLSRADRVAMCAGNPLWVERVDRIYRQLDPGGFSDRITARFTGRPSNELSRSREEVVTSIFADVVGFTNRFEKLTPQQVMDTIRSVFERAVPLFEKFKVRPHQYQGDGLVAEALGEGHESRALDFAYHLLTATNRASMVRTATGDEFGLQLRVGIATGPVVTGALGSQYKLEYLSIGRSVNMAARLQAEARPGELVCSEQTGLRAELSTEMEEFQLKGFAKSQKAFRVTPGLGVYTQQVTDSHSWRGISD